MQNPTFTFVSVSTAKPGKLDDLVRVASRPNELIGQKVDGVVARQVAVDRQRNAVVVWATFEQKEPLYTYLASDEGKRDHGEDEDLSGIIDTFEMYEMTPVSGQIG
jgi:hypothetical protein